jgi:hypothetical protein
MTLLYLLAARLCLKQLEQLQFTHDDWVALTAVILISVALLISHRVHILTGR